MGQRKSKLYKQLDHRKDEELEKWAMKIIAYISNIRYGEKGFTRPLNIRRHSFDALFLSSSPDWFEVDDQNCWEKLIIVLSDYCDVEYDKRISFQSDQWLMTIKNLDKTWSNLEILANKILIRCKGEFFNPLRNDENFFIYLSSNVVESDQLTELYQAIRKISVLRQVPYELTQLDWSVFVQPSTA